MLFRRAHYWFVALAGVIAAVAVLGVTAPVSAASTPVCFADGRINSNCAAPVAIYCNNGGIDVFWINEQGQGESILSGTPEEIAFVRSLEVDEPYLLAVHTHFSIFFSTDGESHTSYSVVAGYWLPSKEFQVNVDSDKFEGKTYTIRWTDCSPGGVTFEKWVEPEK